jgi:anti-anti-sigma factor
MQIAIVEDTGPTAKISLMGKLDIVGVDEVAAPLAALSKTKSSLLIDMAGVTFLTSPGIRQLVMTSKTLAGHGGRLVLLRPNATVVDVLVVSGVRDLMTIVQRDADATAALQ